MLPSSLLGDWRSPGLRVLANGSPVSGTVSTSVRSNNHYAADRFSVSIATSADPAMGPGFWSAQSSLMVEVQMAMLPGGTSLFGGAWQSLIQGLVDTVDLDPIGGLVTLDGRDLTAAFIEARTQETFANRTSSEIATLLAGRHGLAAQVTTTTTPVGRFYQLEHDRITLDQFSSATTEWDLLVFLAGQEGFDVYVQGTTLFFNPPATASPAAFVLQPGGTAFAPANLIDLRLERALTISQDVEVTVKSWNSLQQSAFIQTASSSANQNTTASTTGSTQRYVFVRPNLTMDQALQLAQAKLAEITLHERIITVTMPGELTLTPRSQVLLQGTGTAFDQVYFVDEIERRISVQEGFVQVLRAKNTTVGSQATTPALAVGAVTG